MIKEHYESKAVQIYVEDMEFVVWNLIVTMQNCIVRKIKDSFRIYNSNNNNLMCEFKSDVYHQSERVLW
jgi:hypothetical protein